MLVLALFGAFIFDLFLPLAWQAAQHVQAPFTAAFRECIFWIAIGLLFYLVAEPIRIRQRQIPGWCRYPPIWFSAVLGLLLAGAREEWIPYLGLRRWALGPDWPHSFPIGWVAAILAVGAICLRYLQFRIRAAPTMHSDTPLSDEISLPTVQTWIASGERPRTADEPDFFGHRPLIERIARKVGQGASPVALLGAYGTGKSSILNAVRAELDGMPDRVIVAKIDIWRVPNPEDAPRLALTQIISALDELVDTLELRGLPRSYKRLAAAEPSGWLARVLGVDSSADSLEALERLLPILDAFTARVVLMVEDVERAGREFDTRHLERFLWALRQLDGCGFVLAVDPSSPMDLSKLCDTIERVPRVSAEQVARIFLTAYQHWISAASYIDPHPDRETGDKLQFRTPKPDELLAQLQQPGWETAQEDLLSLLQTPRALKHVIHRVDQAWSHLHGEAELDDIVIVSALRYGAEDAYSFLLANIDLAREKPSELRPSTIGVRDEWEKVVESLPNGPAVRRLVDLLGIERLSRGLPEIARLSPQGVCIQYPVDYFSRVVAEEIGPEELRDQEVLQHIDQWKSGQAEPLVNRLVPIGIVDDHYTRVWQHLAGKPTDEDLVELTELVVDRVLSIYGSSAPGRHPALLALWVKCGQCLPKNRYSTWLTNLIDKATPQSLSLVNSLFYYWTGEFGIVDETAKETIRHSVARAVPTTLKSPEDLVRALSEEDPYSIRQLVTETMKGTGVIEEWRDSLSRQIILGARLRPDVMLPQLANLAADDRSLVRIIPGHPAIFDRYEIDRERMTTLFQGQLDEALTLMAEYEGSDALAQRAMHNARAWLDARASGA